MVADLIYALGKKSTFFAKSLYLMRGFLLGTMLNIKWAVEGVS